MLRQHREHLQLESIDVIGTQAMAPELAHNSNPPRFRAVFQTLFRLLQQLHEHAALFGEMEKDQRQIQVVRGRN